MMKRILVVLILFIGMGLLGGCKSKTAPAAAGNSTAVEGAGSPTATASPAPASGAAPEAPGNPGGGEAAASQMSEPPTLDVGLSVEQAYAAIPHRRTVWGENDSTVPAEEKAYLRVIFEVIDQGVAVRVAGLQNYSAQQYDAVDPVDGYDRLIGFARGMTVPPGLAAYHQRILEGLAGQRQFFADWKAERDGFRFAKQIGDHAGAHNASAALRAAYNELMSKYPNESAANKDAFFDYHCALDFL